jgi:hypothetical protein
MVMTEHRYYGQSQPFADLSTDNLQYLTSEQVRVRARVPVCIREGV